MKSGDGTPTTPRGQKTQEAILAAAFAVAVADGLDGLRTRAVADRAGVNIATLHYYFPHKEDLEQALLHWLLARFREQPPDRRGRQYNNRQSPPGTTG
ncbi:possible transcriptional regulator, TetR family, putative [Sulfobacillus acidophilus TPY]|uniref:Regulatory protein TetR n=1 Tax=Sulfobacillus acidophilus (strain ATCC 700253 / DSM 10332 / NAL) TaxID=679936 RepID=G8U0X3_SULAD|nr:possible transcriptional regulator, TetR family, putative [Sulfobacillus acidophilus TPY]AEW06518.1 regulatory protein TetR [Sulfobacillus acidophilus DSM 10332]